MKKTKKDPAREDESTKSSRTPLGGKSRSWGGTTTSKTKSNSRFRPTASPPKSFHPLRKGETVEVQRMAGEDACSAAMLVLIRWHGRTMAVPLSQLVAIDPNQSAAEAIGDWHYWVSQGYCF
jgi:hypothetical protein